MSITRPWITPDDVRSYTDNETVAARSDAKLAADITRAEAYVTKYVGHDFTGDDYADLTAVPDDIKTALLVLAEAYALNATKRSSNKQSETFDDYSYTLDTSEIDVNDLGLSPLLDPYITPDDSKHVFFRMRAI